MILLIGIIICAFIVLLGNSKKDGEPMLDKESGLYIWAEISLIVGIIAYIIICITTVVR